MLITVLAVLALAAGSSGQQTKKTWLLAIEPNWGAFSYVDQAGYFRGFLGNLTDEVCAAAGINCEVMINKFSDCITTHPGIHPILGEGLQGQYVDACVGCQATVERIHFGKQSIPFALPVQSNIYWASGTDFNQNDFSGTVKMGFVQGWTGSEKCLARCKKGKPDIPLKTDKVVYYTDPDDMAKAVINGTIQGLLGSQKSFVKYVNASQLTLGEECKCVIGGATVTERMDGLFTDIWNYGFNKLVRNGVYSKLCAAASNEKGTVNCIPDRYDFSV